MIIIANEKYHHLAANVDRVEYKTLCKIAGKDPLKNHTVTIKNKFGCFDIKDNQQVFCTDRKMQLFA